MSAVAKVLEVALAEAAASEATLARLAMQNDELCDQVFDLQQQLTAANEKLQQLAIELARFQTSPSTTEILAESIALAQSARKFGLTVAQARELFASVDPAQAAAISRIARAESDRARDENARRQARRGGK